MSSGQFRVLPQNALSEQHFDEWPVWSEHYDYDEIEDIVRWGLDQDEVLQAFRDNEHGNEHCVYTLLEANPFPPRMRIFIRAALETADGQSLKGYVVNEEAYGLAVFHNGQTFFFNNHPLLDDTNREQERKLSDSLGSASTSLFPMTYRTDFRGPDGELIAGAFQYRSRSTNPPSPARP